MADMHIDSTSEPVNLDETDILISADKVEGTDVYDMESKHVGTVDSIMLNKRTGEVAYSVMSFGGFLGIGERYHPLPWDVLTYDTELGGYKVNQSAAQLKDAPNYSRSEIDSRDYARSNAVGTWYGSAAQPRI
jgi:hypothetical protein